MAFVSFGIKGIQRHSKAFKQIRWNSIQYNSESLHYHQLDSTNIPKDRIFVRKTRKNQSRSLRFASQNSSQTARRSQHARIRRNRVISTVRRTIQKRHFRPRNPPFQRLPLPFSHFEREQRANHVRNLLLHLLPNHRKGQNDAIHFVDHFENRFTQLIRKIKYSTR